MLQSLTIQLASTQCTLIGRKEVPYGRPYPHIPNLSFFVLSVTGEPRAPMIAVWKLTIDQQTISMCNNKSMLYFFLLYEIKLSFFDSRSQVSLVDFHDAFLLISNNLDIQI